MLVQDHCRDSVIMPLESILQVVAMAVPLDLIINSSAVFQQVQHIIANLSYCISYISANLIWSGSFYFNGFRELNDYFFHFFWKNLEETGRNCFLPHSSTVLGRNVFLPEETQPCDKCQQARHESLVMWWRVCTIWCAKELKIEIMFQTSAVMDTVCPSCMLCKLISIQCLMMVENGFSNIIWYFLHL